MNPDKNKLRSQIETKYKWSLEDMYDSDDQLTADIDTAVELATKLAGMQGQITGSAACLHQALDLYAESLRYIENALTYAHMRKDEDNSDASSQQRLGRAMSAYSEISALTSFLEPEILSAEEDVIRQYISSDPDLDRYGFLLQKMMQQKEHTLSHSEERILASLSEVTRSFRDIFTVLNNVDLVFDHINDENGVNRNLTIPSYIRFMESANQSVRESAYQSLYKSYKAHINTIAALYNSSVKKDTLIADLRHYGSVLESRLQPDSIPLTVYDDLISTVHDHLPAFHKYIGIRARLMGKTQISMFDVYQPVTGYIDRDYSFEEAIQIVCEALKPLGDEYVTILRKGLLEERWVDVYENQGKTSGAYSFGSYDSKPYILMNFGGRLRDVFTLIHESGHSMHSYYTRHTQPYIYGDHSIFTAEVASTVNEVLLIRYLLDHTDDKAFRAYLINFYIDEFKGTLFRQTMFAEFERYAHEYSENGGTLTAEDLCARYNTLNEEYYGPYMKKDDIIKYEWARIPHFYRPYYVYQYATGFSAANAIAARILEQKDAANAEYRRFLSSGSSDTPIQLLKIAGADMSTKAPVESALFIFDQLVDELDDLTRG